MRSRELFVEPLLEAPRESVDLPPYAYDEDRAINVLGDGSPLVEVEGSALGTETMTHATGESSDADDASLGGTMTNTFVQVEATDRDEPVGWGGTQLDTRRFPADVEPD